MSLTSVVHDFAVLYSTRVLQKEKRWSDGRMRFYEFNNKIEVYSEENMLVASDFYPHGSRKPLQSGIFADGEVYRLPSGKMVLEFSEYLGCSVRDITNAFQKTKVKQENVPAIEQTYINTAAGEEMAPVKGNRNSLVKTEKFEVPLNLGLGPPIALAKQTTAREVPRTASVQRPRRIGLSRAKTKQVELTSLVKVSTDDKLNSFCKAKARFQGRIPPGSNRLSMRLYKELRLEAFLENRAGTTAAPVGYPLAYGESQSQSIKQEEWEDENYL